MKNKDILITGLGVISAAGSNLSETLDSFSGGKRNAGKVTLFDTAMKYPVFEVKNLSEQYYMEGMRTVSLALCAMDEALGHARLGSDLSKYRVGVCMGTTVACQLSDLSFYKAYRETRSAPMGPVDRYLKGNIAEFISRRYKTEGPVLSVVNACSSGSDAIGVARSWLNNGLCDIAIAGGADELNRVPLSGFGALGIVSHELCAPFDRDRKGLNLGEGSGVLVLETEGSAARRGVSSDLCLLGYGSASDAYHLTSPKPDGAGLEASILEALSDSGTKPEDICFVNAHGTATRDNDAVEGKVLAKILGPDLKMLSTKGFTGHTLGAAGGLEAAFSAVALREGWVPANVGFKNRDGDLPAPLTENTAINGEYALSTSIAFGGNNAALLFHRRHKK